MDTRVARRQLLLSAGLGSAAIAGLAFPTIAAAADNSSSDNNARSLEGAWLVTHTETITSGPPGTTGTSGPTQAVATFASGGALGGRDLNPPGPPEFGAWAKTGDNRFVATFYNGILLGPPGSSGLVLKVVLHGHWEGDQMSGTDTLQFLDSSGNVIGAGTGTFTGTRIKAGT